MAEVLHGVDIGRACEALQQGDLVALPTETVYGLAGDALNTEAVQKIFAVKGRPLIDPLIVHTHSLEKVRELAVVPDELEALAKDHWPGPLTVILPKRSEVPDLVTAGLDTVAIRLPAHPLFRAILESSNLALAAPSANPFGYISPSEASHVQDQLGDRLSLIVDGGPCRHGVESTILNLSSPQAEVLRPGPLTADVLEASLGRSIRYRETHAKGGAQKAAGQLHRHYSPRTTCLMAQQMPSAQDGQARVFLARPDRPARGDHWLSENGDPLEMMHQLYRLTRRLDQGQWSTIVFESPPSDDQHRALLDRMTRATARD